jgi:hypothetical protein
MCHAPLWHLLWHLSWHTTNRPSYPPHLALRERGFLARAWPAGRPRAHKRRAWDAGLPALARGFFTLAASIRFYAFREDAGVRLSIAAFPTFHPPGVHARTVEIAARPLPVHVPTPAVSRPLSRQSAKAPAKSASCRPARTHGSHGAFIWITLISHPPGGDDSSNYLSAPAVTLTSARLRRCAREPAVTRDAAAIATSP